MAFNDQSIAGDSIQAIKYCASAHMVEGQTIENHQIATVCRASADNVNFDHIEGVPNYSSLTSLDCGPATYSKHGD